MTRRFAWNLSLFLVLGLALLACDGKEEVLAELPDDELAEDADQLEPELPEELEELEQSEVEELEELEELPDDVEDLAELDDADDEAELCQGVPHASWYCYEDSVYWYDSCGLREELKESCAAGCSVDACIPEPSGYELVINFLSDYSELPAELCNPLESRRLYRGRVTMSSPNTGDFEYLRCDGEAFDITMLWVTAAGTDILNEGDVAVYFPRVHHLIDNENVSLEDEGRRLVVRNVPIWPTELDLDAAVCDSFKSMALITDRTENPGARHFYQHQSVTFVKTCAP